MGTILEKIFKSDSSNEIDSLNISFFTKYFDKNLILKLIDIRRLYLDIFASQKNKSKEERDKYLIKSELDKLLKIKNKLVLDNNELIDKKRTLLESFKDSVTIKKIKIDDKLNELIIKNLADIKIMNEEIKSKAEKFNSLEPSSYNRDLLIDNLKYKLNNINILEEFNDSYNKKDLYEEKLSIIISNKNVRKCYMTYLFLAISLDLDNLYHTYNNANLFAFHTYKNERKIALENTSINLEHSLSESICELLDEYIEIINSGITDNELDIISKEKLKYISIINTMNHFAKNHSFLSDDKDIKAKEYNMIKEYINDLEKELEITNSYNLKKTITGMIDIFNKFSDNL